MQWTLRHGKEIENMDINSIPVEEVLDMSSLEEYNQKIKQLYLGHFVPLNANIYVMEQIALFPFRLFGNPLDDMFLPLVYQNFYQISLLIISRLANDQTSDFLTLNQFRNDLIKMIKPTYIELFLALLKQIKFDKETKQLLVRVRCLRDSYIAHIKRDPSISTTEYLSLEELKFLRDILNKLLRAFTFNVEHMMLPMSYASGDKKVTDIERILDNIARESTLVNAPEQDPLYWISLQGSNSPLSEKSIKIINMYRLKFGLPEV